jgi:hypothetical protein
MVLAALWFIASPACGDTTGDNSTASAAGGTSGTETGGGVTGGVPNGGMHSDGSQPSSGGAVSSGGYRMAEAGGTYFGTTGGTWVTTGGIPATGGSSTGGSAESGGTSTGGASSPTGGTQGTGGLSTGGIYSEQPPNGATCLCLLAERLHLPGGSPQAACTSVNPNDCTLQKAYCGQTCAGDAGCGVSCIAGFSEHAFDDAATYSYGSCTVIIRCPAPSS